MALLGFNFSLIDQLAFYGSYHRNKWNQIIHFFFVPLILWSFAVWFCATGPLPTPPVQLPFKLDLPEAISRCIVPNGAAVLVTVYGAYYLALEPAAGASWAVLVALPLYLSANAFWQGVERAGWWALGAQVLAWYMQLHPGHKVLEGRRPALLDSFWQSMVLAPLFVWMELLFVCGYRPQLQRDLAARIQAKVAAKEGPAAAAALPSDDRGATEPLLATKPDKTSPLSKTPE